jgi:hypothetical protein
VRTGVVQVRGLSAGSTEKAADLKCRLQQEDFKKEIGIKNGGLRYSLAPLRDDIVGAFSSPVGFADANRRSKLEIRPWSPTWTR